MKGLIIILRSLVTPLVSGVKRKETIATALLLIAVAVGAQLFNLPGPWVTHTLECLNQSPPPTSADTSTKDLPKTTTEDWKAGIPNLPE